MGGFLLVNARVRRGTLLLILVLASSALVAPASVGATDTASDHRIDAPATLVAALGIQIIDDHGAFVTARLDDAQAARLVAQGVRITPIMHTLGRGAIPADLRAPDASPLAIVQFRGPVKAEWRAVLDATALAVYDYLPQDSYLVRLDPAGRAALLARPEVRAVESYHPAWKIAPAMHTSGNARVTALAFLGTPLADVLAEVAGTGALPVDATTTRLEHVIDAIATPDEVRALARLDSVVWLEPAYDEGSLDNAHASAIVQGATVDAWPLHARGVDGSSQKVSLCDTGVNTRVVATVPGLADVGTAPFGVVKMDHEMHDDLAQPFVVYNAHLLPTPFSTDHRKIDLYYSPRENGITRGDSDDSDGHGTHTAGTLAGDAPDALNGSIYGTRNGNDGVAFAAKLLVCDITTGGALHILNDYANYWDPAYARGARIHSNSWGSTHTSAYTEKARQHDDYVWTHRDFVILRSMGNLPDAIRPEAVAKNVLSIGSTRNGASMDELASSSGNGPTDDGRIKPNVVAPGACLVSAATTSPVAYVCMSGTSMATPVVAGAAALVRDHFAKGYYPSGNARPEDARNPSAALVRAILEISGREIEGDRGVNGFPNAVQGWGRVTLADALGSANDPRRLQILSDEHVALGTGGTFAASVTVTAGQPVRILLAWTDHAAAAGADPALVNDLDLRVTDPNGAVLGDPDAHNVEEGVTIAAPLSGTYTLIVTGVNVPQGPQPFALVAVGDVA